LLRPVFNVLVYRWRVKGEEAGRGEAMISEVDGQIGRKEHAAPTGLTKKGTERSPGMTAF